MANALGHLIVSGRWDDNVAIVDVAAALRAENDGTPNAVLARPRATPDVDTDGDGKPDAKASGQPVSIAVDAQSRFAYVVNHSGGATPAGAAGYQHGHPGLVGVVDLKAARDKANDGTLGAIAEFVPTGRTGPVGCAITPDGRTLLVNCGEAEGSEDGGDEITAIDVATRKVVRRIPLAEMPGHPAPGPSKHDSPHPSFGRYPNPTGLGISALQGGLVFVANGGFSDVSVLSLEAAMAGDKRPEIGRVAIETGPFGLAVSDVARAAAGGKDAEVARVRVGSDDPNEATRPFAVAFAPDGKRVVATCFRSNTISLIDVDDAIAGRSAETLRLYPRTPTGALARPRGIAIAGGRYACVIGGAKAGPGSSLVWFLDLESGKIVSCTTGVGNESYMLAAF